MAGRGWKGVADAVAVGIAVTGIGGIGVGCDAMGSMYAPHPANWMLRRIMTQHTFFPMVFVLIIRLQHTEKKTCDQNFIERLMPVASIAGPPRSWEVTPSRLYMAPPNYRPARSQAQND